MSLVRSINKIRVTINDFCDQVNSQIIERKRKLDFRSIFFILNLVNVDNKSYNYVCTKLKTINIDVSKTAILQKRDNIDYKYFVELSHKLLDSYYNILSIPHTIFAIDGSQSSLPYELSEEGYKLTKKGKYCKGLISCLFDVNNQLPVDCYMSNCKNERKAIINSHIKYIPKYSIVLHDRGYYSGELLELYNTKNIYPIFRMKISDLNVKDMIDNNYDDKNYNVTINDTAIKFRIVKYTIVKNNKTKNYYLGTTLMDTIIYSIDKLKHIYHDRWCVETYFDTLKNTFNHNNHHSKTEDNIKKELYIQVIVSSLTKFLQIISKKHIKNKLNNTNKKQNHKTLKNFICSEILFLILYRTRKTNNKLIKLLIIAISDIIYSSIGQSYPRLAVKPSSLWYFKGLS